MDDLAWMEHAACRRVDPELFFLTTGGGQLAKASRAAHVCVCHCPVRGKCDRFRRDIKSWRECVIAGVQYGQNTEGRRAVPSPRSCPICVGVA